VFFKGKIMAWPKDPTKLQLAKKRASISHSGQIKPITFFINERGCHICTSHYCDRDGYPRIKKNNKAIFISHFVWEREQLKPVPQGMNVLHKCDTPACINFEHLFLGTTLDNNRDKVAKGRQPRGEKSATAKLTEAQALAIINAPEKYADIAKRFGTTVSNVNNIKNAHSWKHLMRPLFQAR
jgi:hypothetical protein